MEFSSVGLSIHMLLSIAAQHHLPGAGGEKSLQKLDQEKKEQEQATAHCVVSLLASYVSQTKLRVCVCVCVCMCGLGLRCLP